MSPINTFYWNNTHSHTHIKSPTEIYNVIAIEYEIYVVWYTKDVNLQKSVYVEVFMGLKGTLNEIKKHKTKEEEEEEEVN